LGAKVTEVRDGFVAFEKDGKTEKIAADKVLLSIGRRASTTGTGLESVGVYTERGAVVTDRFMKTNVAGIYAVGDVNGKSMLAHTAYREAEVAVNNMLGKRDSMRYGAIPSVIYTTPEVGAVGETAETAREKGIRFEEVCLPLIYSGRYVAENEGGDGVCKLLLEKKTRRLIGCHMICAYASEIIVSAGILIESQFRVDDIKEFVFPHPTVGEIIREGIFKF
jgi:dihydrolipoamide dehydrogenase